MAGSLPAADRPIPLLTKVGIMRAWLSDGLIRLARRINPAPGPGSSLDVYIF